MPCSTSSAEIGCTCSEGVEVCGSALYSSAIWESCSVVAGSAACSAICLAAGCYDRSGLEGATLVGTWTDEEILLKIFVRSPRKPCSPSEVSSSITGIRGVVMEGCAGWTKVEGCTGLRGCAEAGEGKCEIYWPELWRCWVLNFLIIRWSSSSRLGGWPLARVGLGACPLVWIMFGGGVLVVEIAGDWTTRLWAALPASFDLFLFVRIGMSCSSSELDKELESTVLLFITLLKGRFQDNGLFPFALDLFGWLSSLRFTPRPSLVFKSAYELLKLISSADFLEPCSHQSLL